MEEKNIEQKSDSSKLTVRAIVLVGFLLVLVIMLSFIHSIINERNNLYDKTVIELGATWGAAQTVAGPALIVPYRERVITETRESDGKGKTITLEKTNVIRKNAIFLPESLNSNINITDEIRNRGIYKATVYTADIGISGSFDTKKIDAYFKSLGGNISPNYDETFISFGITDTTALLNVKTFFINGVELKKSLSSGSNLANISQFKKGISAKIGKFPATSQSIPYDIGISLRGSNKLSILPLGEENKVNMESKWPNPSFEGYAAASKNITEEGFTAEWLVSKLSRNYPQEFSLPVANVETEYEYDEYGQRKEGGGMLSEASFGVKLYDGITHYRLVVRAVKYGYLFFALSLLVLFIFDVTSKTNRVHFLQYGIIGISLVMFYLLLLSLSEHIAFIRAYLISTAAVVIPISLYIIGFMKDKKYGILMFAILTGLYMILLSILQMENYALIMGTALVMFTIYVLMYLTRHLKGNDKRKNS